jgi:hypothetical protein
MKKFNVVNTAEAYLELLARLGVKYCVASSRTREGRDLRGRAFQRE